MCIARLRIFVPLATLLILIAGCDSTDPNEVSEEVSKPTADSEGLASVTFERPVSVKEALDLAKSHGSSETILRRGIDLNGETVTQYYKASTSQTPEEVRQEWKEMSSFFLQKAQENIPSPTTTGGSKKSSALAQQLSRYENLRARSGDEEPSLVVGKMKLFVTESEANKISSSSSVKEVVRKSEVEKQQKELGKELRPSKAQSNVAASGYWAPDQGNVETEENTFQDYRYVSSDFSWSYSQFTAGDAYEHDYYLYNYDGRTYLSQEEDYGDFPVVRFAQSNLPTSYLDTRSLDDRSELAFTMGSARAQNIVSNTIYYVQIATDPGNASTDKAKLNAQLGYQLPRGCTDPYCIENDRTSDLIDAWDQSVPGYGSW